MGGRHVESDLDGGLDPADLEVAGDLAPDRAASAVREAVSGPGQELRGYRASDTGASVLSSYVDGSKLRSAGATMAPAPGRPNWSWCRPGVPRPLSTAGGGGVERPGVERHGPTHA